MITFRRMRLPDGLGMRYSPSRGSIEIDMTTLRASPSWKRQFLALFCHELVHFWQWHIIYKHDAEGWNGDRERRESQADMVQDSVLHVLGVRI